MTPKQKRTEIKRLLALLDEHNRYVFVMMYSPPDENPNVDDLVDSMAANKLSWALTQCQNSYYRLFKVIQNA